MANFLSPGAFALAIANRLPHRAEGQAVNFASCKVAGHPVESI